MMLFLDLKKHRNDDAVEHADCGHGELRVIVEAMLVRWVNKKQTWFVPYY